MKNESKGSLLTKSMIILAVLVQIVLGIIFIFSPKAFPSLLGLPSAPAWTDWIFSMFGARALGFAYGMLIAMKDLQRHSSWLMAMIIVQAIDWVGTIFAIHTGKITLMQASTAAFFPVLFVLIFSIELYRQNACCKERNDK